MAEIVENLAAWGEAFEAGWLAHFNQTGETNFKDLYKRPRNKTAVAGPAIDLSQSKLVLVTSAGSYLPESQEPYDAENDLGDYSIRVYPAATSFDKLAYAHTHYDHAAVDADPQVLVPLRHLEDMVSEGKIGSFETVISFMGYQPDARRTVNETVPAVVAAAKADNAQAVLLVPA